jgi:trehalose 6-phosphate synthase
VFRAFPWKEELLDGLLGNDLLGFHLQYHCANFLETVDRGLEAMIDEEHSEVWRRERVTRVRPFPISIDFDQHVRQAEGPTVRRQMERWRAEIGPRCEMLGIGIDRADYTKGIPERLLAIDHLLENHEEYRGRLVFVQVAVPSRTHISEYQRLNKEIETTADAINRRWSRDGWNPIHLCRRHLPQPELMALHRLANFCLVSSLHDGMNLVAKEFVASRSDEDGVLVLSSFTGAARELTSALPINPFSSDQMAMAIRRALTMPPGERHYRMRSLRNVVRENNIYSWAANVIGTVLQREWREQVRPQQKIWARAAG